MWNLFKKFENKCKNKHKVQIKLSKIQTCMTDLASYSLKLFWQLTLKWLSGVRAKDENKTYYCILFFLEILSRDSRKIHYLTNEFRVKLLLKTDITFIASRFVRYRFFCAISVQRGVPLLGNEFSYRIWKLNIPCIHFDIPELNIETSSFNVVLAQIVVKC